MDGIDEPGVVPIDPDVAPAPTAPAPGLRQVRRSHGFARADVLVAIGIGGAFGTVGRDAIERALPHGSGGFPWATFLINISGSLLLGLFLVVALERMSPNRHLRPFVATGFIGSFTTFSTFAVEVDLLVRDGHAFTAAMYLTGTMVAGLACAWVGVAAGRSLIAREGRYGGQG